MTMSCENERGLSLLEVLISGVITSIIALAAVNMRVPMQQALGSDTIRMEARSRASRALERVTHDLRGASFATLKTLPVGFKTWQTATPNNDMDDLQYQSYTFDPDTADELPTLSGARILQLVDSPEDPGDGKDNDGDGVTDEKTLTLELPGQQPDELIDNVTSCALRISGRTLEIQIRVTLRSPKGDLLSESVSDSVEIRND